jgi:hypothetical protein
MYFFQCRLQVVTAQTNQETNSHGLATSIRISTIVVDPSLN